MEGRRSGASYAVVELPCDWTGRSFRFEKVAGGTDPGEPAYSVFCSADGEHDRCDCKGFARWHHCKHTDAAAALVANGWL